MTKKLSIVAAITCAIFFHGSLFSQSKAPLGTKEIRGAKQVQFQNKNTRRASASVIRDNTNTGKKMAEMVRSNPEEVQSFKGIQVQRILPEKDSDKFGADIVRISPDQSFDHINSINRILAAYIESSFQYKEADADTLATYVLYYNAAHRQDKAFAESKYSPEVVGNLDPQKIGIDINYKNWPGKSEILIPISGNILKDGGQDVTTDELEEEVDRLVKNEKDPDNKKRMEEESKKMNELQDQKLKDEKKQVEQKKQELAKKEEELDKKQSETDKKLNETGKILQDLRKDPVKNASQIVEKEKEVQKLEEEKAKIEEEKKQVAETKEELEKKEEEIAKKEEAREEKKNESSSSSGDSSGDSGNKSETTKTEETKKPEEKVEDLQRELAEVREELKKKEEKSENVIDNKIFFMKFIKYDSDGHYSNELWAIDPVKDDALFKSPFTNICSKEFIEVPNQGILVLGYEGAKVDDRKHKLTYLDKKTLKLKKQSDASDVFWRTPMIYTDDKIYVIEKHENNYHLTRFNPDLSVDVRSSAPVEENSEITFFKDKIYITGKGKGEGKTTIKVFQRSDLSQLKNITP